VSSAADVAVVERAPARSLLSPHPGKAAVERCWLWYTPVWTAVVAAVMVSRVADRWTDVELIPLGAVLAAGAVVLPLVTRPASERGIPLRDTAAVKMAASVVGLSLLLNYSQTPFFFDVLHMHYGFHTEVEIRGNPVALYLLTVPYFATYCVLCLMAYRAAQRLRLAPARIAAAAMAPFAVAFVETVTNANPFTRHLFCYDDLGLMLWFGTFAYGTAFCLALPVWLFIDERPGVRVGLFAVVVGVAAAVYADSLLLDVYRHHLAPHVTTVVDGARDRPGPSCLAP
jgi:cycloeucalenol cycloisomerase